jgi:choline dehydrogenase-like flavoprotein
MSFPFSRERHRDLMLRYRHLSQFGVMISDRSRGQVRERAGRVEVRYDLISDDVAKLRRGTELLAECYRAAGAKRIFLPLDGGPEDRLPDRPLSASELTLMAFHPLGTARADAHPGRGVVDGDLRVHGVEGIYVSDGSVVPSSLGVNPQITIMALATRLAFHLLGKPPPEQPDQRRLIRALDRA